MSATGNDIMIALGFSEVNEYGYPVPSTLAEYISHKTVQTLMDLDVQDVPRLIAELQGPDIPMWAAGLAEADQKHAGSPAWMKETSGDIVAYMADGWFPLKFLIKRLELHA